MNRRNSIETVYNATSKLISMITKGEIMSPYHRKPPSITHLFKNLIKILTNNRYQCDCDDLDKFINMRFMNREPNLSKK